MFNVSKGNNVQHALIDGESQLKGGSHKTLKLL